MKNSIFSAFFTFAIAATSVLAFNSCSNDDGDTTRPAINMHSPADGATFEPGSTIPLRINFSDNEKVASFMVEIHSSSDGHTHERAESTEPESFHFSKSWDISDLNKKEHLHEYEIPVPEEGTFAEGHYHLMVYCFDGSLNQHYIAREIVIGDAGEHGHEHEHE